MVFWNAPDIQINHPDLSIKCALEIQQKVLEFNWQRAKDKLPPLKTRIGIHTGTVLAGEQEKEAKAARAEVLAYDPWVTPEKDPWSRLPRTPVKTAAAKPFYEPIVLQCLQPIDQSLLPPVHLRTPLASLFEKAEKILTPEARDQEVMEWSPPFFGPLPP